MDELIASGKNILLKKIEQENEKQNTILVRLGDINPTLTYGQVISAGSDCNVFNRRDGEFVYVKNQNISKLIHSGMEYWIANEDDILVYIEDRDTTHSEIRKDN